MLPLKPVEFVGSSCRSLSRFPEDARREAGFQLYSVQRGLEPVDWKALSTVGTGVCELRIQDLAGEFRIVYVARFPEAIYVLHAFSKKTRKTTRLDLELVRGRYRDLVRMRK